MMNQRLARIKIILRDRLMKTLMDEEKSEELTEDVAELLYSCFVFYFVRRRLRKRGAPEWVAPCVAWLIIGQRTALRDRARMDQRRQRRESERFAQKLRGSVG